MHNGELDTTHHRLLVIDDNPSIHKDFRKILEPDVTASGLESAEMELFGEAEAKVVNSVFDIDSAYQGQEGLALVERATGEQRPYALAFVDVRMPPGWDGVETIQRIWERYPELQVVICTAYSDYSWDSIVQKLGRSDSLLILKKPFDSVEVLQLAHALTRKFVLTQQAKIRMADLDQLVQQRTAELIAANQQLQREVDQRAAVQEALRVSEERFSKAFQSTPVPLAILERAEETLMDANPSFLELAALEREGVVGRRLEELGLWHDAASWRQFVQRVGSGKLVRHQPAETVRPDGSHRQVLLSLEPLQVGAEACLLLICQDITEQKLLERQLVQSQKMEAIGQLAAGVAHDFNNLLTIIQGHASLQLANQKLDQEVLDSLRQVGFAAERASSLTRQLLAFSRKQVQCTQTLDIPRLLDQLEPMLRRLLGEGVELGCDHPPELPSVLGDNTGIEQILMNLVVNARDALPESGRITITAAAVTLDEAAACREPQARPGDFVSLEVSDDGCGIPLEIVARIWDPFFTTKPVGKGTGLGLSTVYSIVKQHRGWIEVESVPGQGTTFRVFLPAAAAASTESSNTTLFVKRKAATTGKETILMVEDEPALRAMAVQCLRRQGYLILEAGSAKEALQIWEQSGRTIDLLLTDVVLPGGTSGVKLAKQLQAQRKGLRTLFSTGYSTELMQEDLLLMEGVNFLQKPYNIEKLLQTVRRCLDAVEVASGTTVSDVYEAFAEVPHPVLDLNAGDPAPKPAAANAARATPPAAQPAVLVS